MKRLFLLLPLIILLAAAGGYMVRPYLPLSLDDRPVIGRVERVYVKDAKFLTTARIDTGAGVSSINAEIVKVVPPKEEGGKETVVFKVLDDEKHIITLTREIVDWQNIKKKGAKNGYSKRPVVMMNICVAGRLLEARVNLADRTQFLYPVLIGRNLLKMGDFMIDPAQKFTHKPFCPRSKKR